MRRRNFLLGATAAQVAAGLPRAVAAANGPVKLIVPFAAGGATDIVARIVSQAMSEQTGQSMMVENRAGAGGNIGSAYVASAPPHGNTWLFNGTTPLAVNLAIARPVGFDVRQDLVPVAMVARLPTAIMVPASLPVRNVQELVAFGKKEAQGLSYGTAGAGTLSQINAELFGAATGVRMVGASYRGSAPLITDLIGGVVQLSFDNIGPALPYLEDGRLRALAVMSAKRSPRLPNVPTLAEAGIPDFDFPSNFAIWGPKGTRPETVAALNKALVVALARPEVITRLRALGFEPVASTPEALAQRVEYEQKTFADIIKRARITLD